MRLAAGSRLGSYQIVSPLGAGGMGEVYRARDTRLDRDVALKVLPSHLSSSPEAKQRLEREARAISQLSHPHVCALFDVGHEEGTDFLVMELLEGDALSVRLERGPLPLEDVQRFGVELAGALDAAHRRGIVHRDLKPANIMLTSSGVKVLDFGLAKTAAPSLPPSDNSGALTVSSPVALTREGSIAGTLQYMSPEQLEGRPADARSDIFALGAVLYEMTTGRRPFAGSSPVALASAILSADPPAPSSLRPSLPLGLERLIRTCLSRDPDRRWQSARDVGLQLEAISEAPPAPPKDLSVRSRVVPWMAAVVALALAFAAGLRSRESKGPPSAPLRFTLPLPEGHASLGSFAAVAVSLSPDGSQLAFVARPRVGPPRLWLRSLAKLEPQPLDGTEGATSAFWSPDGRSLGFFADGRLKRLDLPGGATVPLCDVAGGGAGGGGFFGTWGQDGQILYASIEGEAIYRVSTAGGVPEVEITAGRSPGSPRLNWPLFLPDGRRFLYLARRPDQSGRLMLAEPGQPPREVLSVLSNVAYVDPGYLVFVRGGTLLAQRFDLPTGRVTGEPVSIAGPVGYFPTTSRAEFAASRNGTIVYQSGLSTFRLVWFDRTGRELGDVGTPSGFERMRLSPDRRKVVFDRQQERSGTYDLWALDLDRGMETRLTSDPGSEFMGLWLPDSGLVFSAPRGGVPHLFRKDLTTGEQTELLPAGPVQSAEDASPDGRLLVFSQRGERGDQDVWTLPLPEGGQPSPLLSSPSDEGDVRFSPDGRWIAFTSNESGQHEVYVAPFPDAAVVTRISSGGGSWPRWSRGGREVLYLSADRQLVAVPVRTTPSLEVGAGVTLFTLETPWDRFEPSADGRRLLATVPDVGAAERPYTALVNWTAEISGP